MSSIQQPSLSRVSSFGSILIPTLMGSVTAMHIHCRCNDVMNETSRSDVIDKIAWWCPRCRSRRTIREGSIFYNSRVPLQKWLLLIYFWAKQYPVTDAAVEVAVNQATASKVYAALRGICVEKLRKNPISLGGRVAQSVVQVDDSCFSYRPKVRLRQ